MGIPAYIRNDPICRVTAVEPRAVLLVFVLAVMLGSASCWGQSAKQIVATVNNEPISLEDLDRYQAFKQQEETIDSDTRSLEQEQMHRLYLLRELIDQALFLQKASALGVTALESDVDELQGRFVQRYGSRDELVRSMSSYGLTIQDFRLQLWRSLTVQRLLSQNVSAKVTVSDEEMREYYDSNRVAFTLPEQQVHLAQILVTEAVEDPIPNLMNDDATDAEAANRKIDLLYERLENGEEFEQLAMRYSEDPVYAANGGDMGYVPQSSLDKADIELRRALVSLKPGQFSEVIETGREYRILRLIGIESAGNREFDDASVQKSIRDVLLNRKEQLLRSAFYEMERNRAKIHNYLAEEITESY